LTSKGTFRGYDGTFNVLNGTRTPLYFMDWVEGRISRYFAAGRNSGLPFHAHGEFWNGLVWGRKRWFILPPVKAELYRHLDVRTWPGLEKIWEEAMILDLDTNNLYAPSEADGEEAWLKGIIPGLGLPERPLECLQNEGDVLYIPQGWIHGVWNYGDTVGITTIQQGAMVHRLHREV